MTEDGIRDKIIETIARALCKERGRDPDEETSLYPVDGEGATMDIVVDQWECWRARAAELLFQVELLQSESAHQKALESIRMGARRSKGRFKL